MKITSSMLEAKPRTDPPADEFQQRSAAVMRHFVSLGLRETDLAKSVIPLIARREMDLIGRQPKDFSPAHNGAMLMGHVGTGKTVMLQYAALVLGVGYFDATELSTLYATGGEIAFWSAVRDHLTSGEDLILDDIGAEADVKRFGNQLPIVELIYERYALWKRTGARLWLATNLTGSEIESRYGLRVLDRLKEMCFVVPSVGKSLRASSSTTRNT